MKKKILPEVRYKIAVLVMLLFFGLAFLYAMLFGRVGENQIGKSIPPVVPQNTPYIVRVGEWLALNAETSIRIKSIEPMPTNCNDCFEEVELEVVTNNMPTVLMFRFGGFAGVTTGWVQANNVEIRVLKINSDQIQFEYRHAQNSSGT